jgi:hypothetical protein
VHRADDVRVEGVVLAVAAVAIDGAVGEGRTAVRPDVGVDGARVAAERLLEISVRPMPLTREWRPLKQRSRTA